MSRKGYICSSIKESVMHSRIMLLAGLMFCIFAFSTHGQTAQGSSSPHDEATFAFDDEGNLVVEYNASGKMVWEKT